MRRSSLRQKREQQVSITRHEIYSLSLSHPRLVSRQRESFGRWDDVEGIRVGSTNAATSDSEAIRDMWKIVGDIIRWGEGMLPTPPHSIEENPPLQELANSATKPCQ